MRLFTLLFALVPMFIFAQDITTESLQHGGLDREFILVVPSEHDSSEQSPVIFNFHGFGSNAGQQLIYGDFRNIAEEEGVIVVCPEGTLFTGQGHWNVGGFTSGSTIDDVGFTEAMIQFLVDNYNVDESRIYATGMSNGGYMSYLLACQLGDKIAAIASVTGSMTPETFDECNPTDPTPVMEIHGTTDEVVPYEGESFSISIDGVMEYWVNHNNCNTDPQVIEIEDTNMTDGSTATHYIYSECDNNITNEHFKITNGGHTWPGTTFNFGDTNYDIDATTEIWEFFSRYDNNGLLPSSIDDTQLITSVNVYPNPTSDIINIESSIAQDYQLFNVLGQEILSGKLNIGNQTINLAGIDKGMYFLKTETQSIKLQLMK